MCVSFETIIYYKRWKNILQYQNPFFVVLHKNRAKIPAKTMQDAQQFIVCSQKFNNFSSIFYHLYHCTKVYKMCNFSYIAQKHFRIVENFCTKKQKENFSYVFCAFWRKTLHKKSYMFLYNMPNPSFVNVTKKAFYIMILLYTLTCCHSNILALIESEC